MERMKLQMVNIVHFVTSHSINLDAHCKVMSTPQLCIRAIQERKLPPIQIKSNSQILDSLRVLKNYKEKYTTLRERLVNAKGELVL